MTRLHAAIGILSAAVIAFELVLMQLLSIVQWHHFAYMVISVALLGFGASGTLIALARRWLLDRVDVLVPLLAMASGATMALLLGVSQTLVARFDSYLLFVDASQGWSLLLNYLIFFIPFFLAALAIGLVLVDRVAEIGSYYFANLFGSGFGGLIAIILLWSVAPERLPAATGLIAVLAGLAIVPRRSRRKVLAAGIIALAVSIGSFIAPPDLARSQYKSLSRTLNLPQARILLERSSPYGLVQIVSSPALRYAPGLSLTYPGKIPVQQAVFNNGNWVGPVTVWSRSDSTHLLDFTTSGLPFVMQNVSSALVLSAGTGESVAHAATRRVERIVAVESHALLLDIMRDELAVSTDSLFHHGAVSIFSEDPRAFLSGDTSHYDLVTLPIIGSFGGTVGLSAMRERYSLTREGLKSVWDRLSPNGLISVTAWMDYPYRNALKMLASLVEVLEEVGVEDPTAHLSAVRSWGAVTFVLKRSPLAPVEIQNIREFCDRLSFDPLLLPGIQTGERARYNRAQDEQFFEYVDQLVSPDRRRLYDAYEFDIEPATDNKPYFSQFLKWRSLPALMDQFGSRTFPFLEIGYLIVMVTLVQILLAALILIILPLVRLGWRGPGKGWTLVYFGGIGLGYLFFEIVLIQRFTLYLGHPIYATAAVLATVLVCSGAGSLTSGRLRARRSTMRRVAAAVALSILLYALILTPLLKAFITLPLGLKAVSSFVLLAPPAFVMGMPFPLGLRYLSERSEGQVPWAWGINGCVSVVSTVVAAVLAVEMGFVTVMLLAAGAYGLVALVSRRR